jgi:hypothetical protein
VKDFYESLKLDHESRETNEEVYVPLVIAEEVQTAIPVPTGSNPFVEYQYVEAQAELAEENYDEPSKPPTSNVKIINLH